MFINVYISACACACACACAWNIWFNNNQI